MKKNIRLTENELINLVRRIVNEQMENYSGPSCEDFISRMRDIYEETQSFISRKSDKIRKSDEFRKYGGIYVYNVYEILEDQLGYIVDMVKKWNVIIIMIYLKCMKNILKQLLKYWD